MLKDYDINKKYLIACSGGPDSMALLNMLVEEGFNVIVAHVNYKTRVESDDEEKLVRNYCKEKSLILEVSYFDHNYKGSFEDAARKFRYSFFADVYKKYDLDGLFVAHHKDDLIETFLLKMQRNVINESYLIKTETKINNMKVIRPLLYMATKEELLNYCDSKNIPYGIDKTNFLDITPRNVIRRQLLTKDKNEVLKQALAKESELIETRKKVKQFIKFYPVYLVDDLKDKDDMFLQIFLHEIVLKKYKQFVNRSLLLVLKDFMSSDKSNMYYNVKENYYLVKEYGKITFIEKKEKEFSYVLKKLEYISNSNFKIVDHGLKMHGIYVSEQDFPITIRTVKTDDKISLKEGTKKVSRLFIDKKVPPFERINTIVIENKDKDIIFVYGLYRKYGLKHIKNNLFIEK